MVGQRWGKVPVALALDRRVSAGALRLYALLAGQYANRKGQCWPAQVTLARELGLVRLQTVTGYIRELVGAEWLQAAYKAGPYGNNLYTLRQNSMTPPRVLALEQHDDLALEQHDAVLALEPHVTRPIRSPLLPQTPQRTRSERELEPQYLGYVVKRRR